MSRVPHHATVINPDVLPDRVHFGSAAGGNVVVSVASTGPTETRGWRQVEDTLVLPGPAYRSVQTDTTVVVEAEDSGEKEWSGKSLGVETHVIIQNTHCKSCL